MLTFQQFIESLPIQADGTLADLDLFKQGYKAHPEFFNSETCPIISKDPITFAPKYRPNPQRTLPEIDEEEFDFVLASSEPQPEIRYAVKRTYLRPQHHANVQLFRGFRPDSNAVAADHAAAALKLVRNGYTMSDSTKAFQPAKAQTKCHSVLSNNVLTTYYKNKKQTTLASLNRKLYALARSSPLSISYCTFEDLCKNAKTFLVASHTLTVEDRALCALLQNNYRRVFSALLTADALQTSKQCTYLTKTCTDYFLPDMQILFCIQFLANLSNSLDVVESTLDANPAHPCTANLFFNALRVHKPFEHRHFLARLALARSKSNE